MLSKKMAVSLMSLITIFAFGFIALPALGANEITLSLKDGDNDTTGDQGDYSAGMPGTQVESAKAITIKLVSKEQLGTFASTNVTVTSTHTDPTPTTFTRVNAKEYTFVVPAPNAIAVGGNPQSTTLFIPKDTLTSVETGIADHASAFITLQYVASDVSTPTAHVKRSDETTPLIVEDSVVFTVTLSEEPKEGKFTAANIAVTEATVDGVDFIRSRLRKNDQGADIPAGGTDADDATSLVATGNDGKLYEYSVRIMPKFEKTDPIKFTVKQFEDQFGKKSAGTDPPVKEKEFPVAPSKVKPKAADPGLDVGIPNDLIIPAKGSLVVAKDDGDGSNSEEKVSDSLIMWPGDPKDAATSVRKPALRTYNVIEASLPDLEAFLLNGGTIDLLSAHSVVISEIMWGTDGGSQNRQWIEITNTSDAALTTKDYKLKFYAANEPVPPKTAAVAATATTAAVPAALPAGVADRVGTFYKGTVWSLVNKGQSGNISGLIQLGVSDVEVVGPSSLVSMYRKQNVDDTYPDGMMSGSWAQSTPPSLNFTEAGKGLLVGSPGTSPIDPVVDPPKKTEPTPPDVATGDEITITEIMVDTGNGRLPQWIELTSTATDEVSLEGWAMVIDNAIDAEVLGGGNAITVDLSGVTLDVSAHTGNTGKGQSVLVTAWAALRASDNIRADRVINLATQLKQTSRYQLLSYNGFRITLVPPRTGAIVGAFGDRAGNLHEDWELPMDGRSSLIRSKAETTGMAMPGTDANGWTLASSTALLIGQPSYYGDDEDAGTPGQDAGGPLPVELSHFRPVRDKATGQVVITWATQSELNNAGFFIKRSQQRDGEFKVINATMVPGAGTTSEKQFYTYTDTTAQPNIVYYYQIEDVSLDGNRQTLTNGIRLKGHIGAAGKLTSTWGEIKASNE